MLSYYTNGNFGNATYGETIMANSDDYEWHPRYKTGRESSEDEKRVTKPQISQNAENIALVSECV